MVKVECGKCGGTGVIRAYLHIVGGTCFSCDGRGYFERKTEPVPSKWYSASFIELESGERLEILGIKAKSQKDAMKKASKTSNKPGFQKHYDPATIEVYEDTVRNGVSPAPSSISLDAQG
jgi:hypothetical protein